MQATLEEDDDESYEFCTCTSVISSYFGMSSFGGILIGQATIMLCSGYICWGSKRRPKLVDPLFAAVVLFLLSW